MEDVTSTSDAAELIAVGHCLEGNVAHGMMWSSSDVVNWQAHAELAPDTWVEAVVPGPVASSVVAVGFDEQRQVALAWTPTGNGKYVATTLPDRLDASLVKAIAGRPDAGYLAVGSVFAGSLEGPSEGAAWFWAPPFEDGWTALDVPGNAGEFSDVELDGDAFVIAGQTSGAFSAATWMWLRGEWGEMTALPRGDEFGVASIADPHTLVSEGPAVWRKNGEDGSWSVLDFSSEDVHFLTAGMLQDGLIAVARAEEAGPMVLFTSSDGISWTRARHLPGYDRNLVVALDLFGDNDLVGVGSSGVFVGPAYVSAYDPDR
jgi:hypothetical protein